MNDFLARSGEFSYVTVVLLSFLFGVLASTIGDIIKRKRERTRLIDLFVQDIRRNWSEVDSLQWAPDGPIFSRIRFYLKGIREIPFAGNPEYLFEVYNLKFFEVEGIKLAQLLPSRPRKELWEAYSLMRDAEAVRKVLNELASDNPDYHSYQRLFVELVKRLSQQLSATEDALWRERAWWTKLVGHSAKDNTTGSRDTVSPNPGPQADG